MHDIQKHILKKLMISKKARYSELKLTSVEGNLFSYHLKNLVKDGYIQGKNSLYHLTGQGRHYVDRISFESFRPRIQPKIVTLLVIKNKNKYLLYKRKRMPFMDHIGFPYGKIHLEERLHDSAKRELREKTGLEADLNHRGDIYITVHDETDLISHMLCHVFTSSKISGELVSGSTLGECFWGNPTDHPKNMLIPGVLQIMKSLAKHKNKFFFEEFFLNCAEE